MAGFLDQIEPLKQAALAELDGAADLAALEQARVNYLGANGRFTALMKQLGTLPREEKPAAGKAINGAKVELEAALARRRGELELKAALPAEPTDFTLPGRRRILGKLHPLTQVTEDIVRSFRKIGFVVAEGPERTSLRIEALRSELQDLGVMLRRVAHRLHPAIIDQGGLLPALSQLSSDVSRASGIETVANWLMGRSLP